MSKRWHVPGFVLILILASYALSAQVTVPYPNFVAGTIADPAQVNANFAALSTGALNRTGGTMTGPLVTQTITPATDATYALGSSSFKYTGAFFSSPLTISSGGTNSAATPTAGGVPYGTGTAFAFTAAGTSGQVLVSGGASAPTWGTNVPAGMAMYYTAGASCPAGWTEVTAARGRYVVGLPASGTNAGTAGTALTDLENRPAGSHNHAITDPGHFHQLRTTAGQDGGGTSVDHPSQFSGNTFSDGTAHWINNATTGITINAGGGGTSGQTGVTGTNAPYIQYPFCSKN